MLTECPACSHKVSKAAAACPNCAHPMQSVSLNAGEPVTVEQTSKKYKAFQLAGVVMMCLGVLSAMGSRDGGNSMDFGTLVAVVGIGAYIYGRMGAWWNNG